MATFSIGMLTATADIIYVSPNGSPNQGGASWTDAFNNLQQAINAAQSGDEIWVASGTYTPTQTMPSSVTTTNRDKSFFVYNKNIKIYGGFSGTEVSLSQRDPNRRSVLNGDGDNVLVVESENVILDGFEIKGDILSKYKVSINGEFLQANE